jgi:hypothetical protein
MWKCAHCGERVEADFEICWNCQTEKSASSILTKVEDGGEVWECLGCGADVRAEDDRCLNCGADLSEVQDGAVDEYMGRGHPIVQAKLRSPAMTIGPIILIIGVALIILSPNLLFHEFSGGGGGIMSENFLPTVRITDLRNVASFFGVALLMVGGIVSAVGFSQFNSTRMTVSPGLITQPVVPRSASPKSIELGNTPDEVQLVMGQADKIINLGARVIHVYKDMKIIYVDGKVSDVQLS